MGSLQDLVRDLKNFEDRKVILQELRKEIRQPIPVVRKRIKSRALATLPKSGGLNVWVSKTRVTAQIKTSGRSAGVKLKGSRKSQKNKSDLKRLDSQGRLRHPSWGRRGKGEWHLQQVNEGFFSAEVDNAGLWRLAIERAVDKALDKIRRG